MDGASKFVRGDAVAGIIITVINIIGGIIIGFIESELTIIQILRTYTILTIGDGLPARFLRCSHLPPPVVVTRASDEASLGQTLSGQLLNALKQCSSLPAPYCWSPPRTDFYAGIFIPFLMIAMLLLAELC